MSKKTRKLQDENSKIFVLLSWVRGRQTGAHDPKEKSVLFSVLEKMRELGMFGDD